ncbi:glycosyl transferase, family II [Desulfosarcina variabilis str. Montpellier]|uniref:glycosyltransferase n=1 Tax=Desulfosarcina variabilis TaxID=2300 RepID=UPI003AFA2A16
MNKIGITAVTVVILSLLTLGLLVLTNEFNVIWASMENIPTGQILFLLTKVFFIAHISVFIWRIVLCFQYKPAPPASDQELPTCSVIVPAYNEGRQAYDTIASIVKSDYPVEKMSIIGVDDGSKDDTWKWLKKAATQFPGRVKLFRQPVNRGKRHALYRGFKHGKGEVFVTIDSDSNVDPHTLRHLVSPFVQDKRVGAVAGNVRILNRKEGFIPKMLEVSFAYSFDFLRAGQSVINSVLCTPGALSAYRRRVVMRVLPEWVNQTFLGRAANIGEDRAMTNLILRSGYHVHYQREAMVHTTSPITLTKTWKMLLRWARSNIRETLVISRFVFGKFREGGALGIRINVLIGILSLTVGQIIRFYGLALLVYLPLVVGPKMLVAAAIAACAPGCFYFLRYKSENAIWALPYSYLWLTCLSWISFYAMLTPHKTGWMTRDIKSSKASEVAWASSSRKAPSLTLMP